jgi:tripartite-type tricarboxylate transporter receptor subunit TctC
MNIRRRHVLRLAAGAAALSAFPPGPATAQSYPDRRVRIVVPYSAAGPTDVVVRILSDRLSAAWGQPVVVENRAGGGGNIGTEVVARASPDGYTLLANSSTHVINASLYEKLSYDTRNCPTILSKTSRPLPSLVPTRSSGWCIHRFR